MAEDLGARLIRAGLATREQLADALADGPAQGGKLAARLLERGVSEQDLVGFFLADGFGPLLDARDLSQAPREVLDRVRGEMAYALLALPIRESAAGLVVAMADPSDEHAAKELRYAVGEAVLPTVAKVSDVRAAIRRFYPEAASASTKPSQPPVELVRRRSKVPDELVNKLGDAQTGQRTHAQGPPSEDIAVPLVRTKPFPTPAKPISKRTFKRPSEQPLELRVEKKKQNAQKPTESEDLPSRAVPKDPEERPKRGSEPMELDEDALELVEDVELPEPVKLDSLEPKTPVDLTRAQTPVHLLGNEKDEDEKEKPDTAEYARPKSAPRRDHEDAEAFPEKKPKSLITEDEARWGDLGESTAPPATDEDADEEEPPPQPAPRRRAEPKKPPKDPPPEIGASLAGIRGSVDRDEIVRLACEGALTVARSAVLLALRKGVLRGWDAMGSGVSADAIRNLWIPATAPSMFRKVIDELEPHRGPFGTSAADNLYRAATGSRGGTVVIQPITVGAKAVAVLCADDVQHGDAGVERLEILAHAVGTAFKRIIVSQKR